MESCSFFEKREETRKKSTLDKEKLKFKGLVAVATLLAVAVVAVLLAGTAVAEEVRGGAVFEDDFESGDLSKWNIVSGEWEVVAEGENQVAHLTRSSEKYRRAVSKTTVPDGVVITAKVKGDATGDVTDTTVGFYSNSDASKYWWFDLGVCSRIGLGYYNESGRHVVIDGCVVPTVETKNNIWYNVKIQLTNGEIQTKVWEDGEAEPADWQLSYSGATIYGNHIVIGTEYGQDDEEFWFDDVRVLSEMISVSTDRENYTIGETVLMTLAINRSAESAREMQLELGLKKPCDDEDLLYQSGAFTMPAEFKWNATVPFPIPYTFWIPSGEYCFIGTLRDPTTGEEIASDRACFEIDDNPWMKTGEEKLRGSSSGLLELELP